MKIRTKKEWFELAIKEFEESTGIDLSKNKESSLYISLKIGAESAFNCQNDLFKLSKEMGIK